MQFNAHFNRLFAIDQASIYRNVTGVRHDINARATLDELNGRLPCHPALRTGRPTEGRSQDDGRQEPMRRVKIDFSS